MTIQASLPLLPRDAAAPVVHEVSPRAVEPIATTWQWIIVQTPGFYLDSIMPLLEKNPQGPEWLTLSHRVTMQPELLILSQVPSEPPSHKDGCGGGSPPSCGSGICGTGLWKSLEAPWASGLDSQAPTPVHGLCSLTSHTASWRPPTTSSLRKSLGAVYKQFQKVL